ncbi:MAG: hypothetical protein R2736_19875 [Solirubrobacterales bacterium]
MPATRSWQFEDAAVSLGQVDVDPADVGRMLLIELAWAVPTIGWSSCC